MAPKWKKQLVHEENPNKGEWARRFKANPFVFIGTIGGDADTRAYILRPYRRGAHT